MAELVRDSDSGLFYADGVPAGPAGSAPVTLSPRLEVDIDVAWPARLVRAVAAPGSRGHVEDADRDVVARLREEALPFDLTRLALARMVAADPDSSPLVRAVAMLEGNVGSAIDALLDLDDFDVPPDVADELAPLLRAAGAPRRLVDRLRRARPAFDAMAAPRAGAAAAPMMTSAKKLRVEQPRALLPVDRRSLPRELLDVGIAAVRSGPCEYEIRLDGAAELATACWARAFAPDGTLLALAPFRAAGRDARARLLVPPSAAAADLDVTALPAVGRPSPARDAVRDALRSGRTAARVERLGQRNHASRAWTDSAQRWADAGDRERAMLASRYAKEPAGLRVPPPLLADRLS